MSFNEIVDTLNRQGHELSFKQVPTEVFATFFPGAAEMVPDRVPNRHLTFGTHIHRCLGSHIARLEMKVLLEELLRRLPDFTLQDGAEAEWSKGQVQGVVKVPIRFTPGQKEGA